MRDKVLLVEDNRALAENVAEMLRDEDLTVAVCHDVESAEAEARSGGFDLAIVDIRLAGEDRGLDLVPKLQRINARAEVLLITGNASLDSAIGAIRRGVYAYLTKPFEPEHLIAMVKRGLAQVALKRERQALTQRLSASEALHRSVVESVESCILGLDAQGAIRFCNRFAAERFGLASQDLLGLGFADMCASEDRSAARGNVARALAGTTVRDYEFGIERAGRRRRIRWTLTPLAAPSLATAQSAWELAEQAQAPKVLAAGIDITDRLELERKSAEAEAMAAMGTLTTSLAHEIRNPLNAAKLQLELLVRRAKKLSDGHGQDVLGEPAELVRAEINRLASLLDEFLDLARPRQVELREHAVSALFDEVAKLQKPVLDKIKVKLTTHIEPHELVVRADRDKLKQVLLNLIANAVDALQHTKDPQIRLVASRSQRGIALSVTDNGPGVASELIGSAFTPFVTSKPSGTGLGLSIVQKIARQHGGMAELSANPGGGTTARIEIPT